MRTCLECELCVTVDYGYSSYTVEGTNVYCLGRHHPENGFDQWYGLDKRLNYAEQCEFFLEGERLDMDVDEDNLRDMTLDQRIKWAMFQNTKPKDTRLD